MLTQRLEETIRAGLARNMLQRIPHLILLSDSFYHNQMRPILSEWLLLWLRKQGLRDVTDEQALQCLAVGAKDTRVQASLSDRHVKLLNLGADWLMFLLPHALRKVPPWRMAPPPRNWTYPHPTSLGDTWRVPPWRVTPPPRNWTYPHPTSLGATWQVDRVNYGLLSPKEMKEMSKAGGLPRSRRYLAVPFVGKDAPSHASEFAHPDVAIGLTILAYRCVIPPYLPPSPISPVISPC